MLTPLFLAFVSYAIAINFEMKQDSTFCDCFTNIVNKYFLHSRSNIEIVSEKRKSDCWAAVKSVVNFNNIISEKLLEAPESYIISYDYLSELNNTLQQLRNSPGFSNRVKYLIMANDKPDLLNISTFLWHFRLYRSVILLSTEHKVEFYEMNLKDSQCGRDIKPKKINECVNGLFKHELNLFSVDMKSNFYKCPFRIIWAKAPPWIFHVNSTSNPGIYIELLNMFGQISQFDIVYMPETDVYRKELGYQYSFETLMEDLDRDYADVFVGLVSAAPRAYLESTSVITDDNLYFVLPKPKMIPYWKLLPKLFSLTNWIIAIIILILLSLLLTLLALTTVDKGKFGHLGKNLLSMFSVNLNNGIYIMPHSFRLRWILGSFLIYSLIISAVVQGKFYSFLSSPLYESPITNMEELIESDIPIKFSAGLNIVFMFNGPTSEKVLKQVEPLTNPDLLENSIKAYNDNFATIVDRGVLIMNPNIKNKMQIFDLFSFETCFFMQSKHILFEYFDSTLQRIIEHGFFENFISTIKNKYARQQHTVEENKLFRISIVHMEGAFFVLVIGYLISLMAFICEWICISIRRYIHGNDINIK